MDVKDRGCACGGCVVVGNHDGGHNRFYSFISQQTTLALLMSSTGFPWHCCYCRPPMPCLHIKWSRLGAALQNQRTNHVATLELFHCQRQLEISAGNTEIVYRELLHQEPFGYQCRNLWPFNGNVCDLKRPFFLFHFSHMPLSSPAVPNQTPRP